MPCMSYDTNWANSDSDSRVKKLKAECDKLARIACAAMTELEKQGKEDFLILKNEEVGHWWAKHKEADRKEQERLTEIERKKRVKEEALKRLTEEEKELLGLAPKKHSKVSSPKKVVTYDIEGWDKEESIEYMIDDLKKTYLEVIDTTHKWRGE